MAERSVAELRALLSTTTELARTAALRDELERAEGRVSGELIVYEDDQRLVAYLVRLASGSVYRFWAESAAHALEQAENAEPDQTVTEVALERRRPR